MYGSLINVKLAADAAAAPATKIKCTFEYISLKSQENRGFLSNVVLDK